MDDICFMSEVPGSGALRVTHVAPDHVRREALSHLGERAGDRKDITDGEIIALFGPDWGLFVGEIIRTVAQKVAPDALTSVVKISQNDLPGDRHFRRAWRKSGGSVVVDLPEARKVQMEHIRSARNKRLIELDKRKYGAEYDAERQKMRDIPQTFDLTVAATPEELKSLWPPELVNEKP